jgi:erythromycin esterase-like protein
LRREYAVEVIGSYALPPLGNTLDYTPILELAKRARFVLIGEASHGTHEFYWHRAEITKRLIEEQDFSAVAAEADWPDAYRANRYVKGRGKDRDANQALSDFRRFPSWMWRNVVVLDFIEWLRRHNDLLPDNLKAGFYGLDLYSLHSAMEAVLSYLEKIDPEAARRARYRYSCFEQFGEDTQAYGYAAEFGLSKSCENEVVEQLVELRRRAAELASGDGRVDPDEFFSAEQNARVVKNAEQYYRTMFGGRVESWNLRDTHMMETLDNLAQHFGPDSKIVVWAHNSHLGDARATEMGRRGELNLGQLVRQKYGDRTLLIGFTTYTGAVTAAGDWGGVAERKNVRPGLMGSWEELFHATKLPQFLLLTRKWAGPEEVLSQDRLERAIGVIYLPQTERLSHYFKAKMAQQFDAVMHLDETRALEPLERTSEWDAGELPETYPFAV